MSQTTSSTPGAPLLVETLGDCTVLRLNRPHKLNAIDDGLLAAFEAALAANANDASRALLITGTGRAFCAGTDLGHWHGDASERVRRMHRLVLALRDHAKPSIAALNGLTLGGGLEIAAACTFRVAAPEALLGLPEIKLGLMPLYGGTALLPALIGRTRALELMLSGDSISAATALQWGLLSRVSESGNTLLEEARAFAHSVARHPRVPQQVLRSLVAQLDEHGNLSETLEAELRLGQTVMASYDAREGVAAFVAKRTAQFKDQ